jgi:hypothetical protein
VRQSKAPTDQTGPAKYLPNLIRQSIGHNVKVLWPLPKQQVTYTAADQFGLVAGLLQRADHGARTRTDAFVE